MGSRSRIEDTHEDNLPRSIEQVKVGVDVLASLIRDRNALILIHELLDGQEVDSDTLSSIMEIVHKTGRSIRSPDEKEEEEA